MIQRPTLVAALVAASLAAGPAMAFDAAETGEIEAIVRDYLIRHPEVLLEALDSLEAKRAAEEQASQKLTIESVKADLLASPDGTVLGNPDGDVTVVEFFDYNCGYCKRALADMEALLASDPNIRFVLKEIPVLGPPSEAASRVSLAVREVAPDRYGAFHRELLSSRGSADEARAIAVAAELGIEEGRLRAAMAAPSIASALEDANSLAGQLGITGTPSYVVGDAVIPGAVGLEDLSGRIANVRACGSAAC